MTLIGYTMMCEQAGPKQLVRDVTLAEQAGFDFAVISEHYFPWLEAQGHSPYAWSVLGAAAQATDRIPLMTHATCPIRRYHPAVVAQKAATMQLLSDGRFTLGLGAGENLNEHIVGGRWPLAGVRCDEHAHQTGPIPCVGPTGPEAVGRGHGRSTSAPRSPRPGGSRPAQHRDAARSRCGR